MKNVEELQKVVSNMQQEQSSSKGNLETEAFYQKTIE